MNQTENKKEDIDLSGTMKRADVEVQARQSGESLYRPGTPKVVQWTIKYSGGLVKNETQASYALIGFVIVAITVSLFLVFGGQESDLSSREEFLRHTPPSVR